MKKITALLLSAIFVLTMFASCATSNGVSGETASAAPQESGKNYAGTYTGTAVGYHGDVGVTVTLDEAGKIISVAVNEGHGETKGIGTIAIEKIPSAIAAAQSLKVDAVSGATLTGDGILAAVAAALKNAGLDPADYGYTESVVPAEATYTLNPEAMPKKAPVTGSITITDVKGREVTIDLPVSTYAISTMDVVDYMIPLLGEDAFNKLVASGQDGGGGIQTYAKLYTPVVGNYMEHVGQISEHNAPFDLEMILAMDPDVLIVNSAMSAHNYALEVESQLTAAGIPIVLVDVPGKSFTTSAQSTLKLLGQVFQKEDRAAEVASFLDEQFTLIASKNLSTRTDKPTVYYEKSGYSEVFGSTSTSKSGWGAVIAAAGGENIADPIFSTLQPVKVVTHARPGIRH
jgi:iron complex transport system substrate-binding protein